MRMPISKGGGAKFRGPTSSHDYNNNEDDKYSDLLELYKQSNENLQSLQEANRIVLAEHAALQNYVSLLESKLNSLENQMANIELSNSAGVELIQTAFVDQMVTRYPNDSQENGDTSLRCDVDLIYRYVTTPLIHQIPKTYTINEKTNEIMIPNELDVQISRTNTKGIVEDNNVYNAFNGDNDSFWQRTVTYNLAEYPNYEDIIMEITLPSHLVNNLNINCIQIHPHPERGIQIQNVEVNYQNAWQTIPGFVQEDLAVVDSNQFSPRKKWFFPDMPVQKIRITFLQNTPLDLNGKKVFLLGAQEIGVYLTLFETGGGMILTPFEMNGLYNIESVEHIFLNRSAFGIDKNLDNLMEGNVFDYHILKEMDDGTLIPIMNNEWAGQSAKRLWVKTNLMPYNGVNPCLTAVRLHYSH